MTSATASTTVVADLLGESSSARRLARLSEEGLADEVGVEWLLDRVTELVHDDPAAADDLAALCATAAIDLTLPALTARAHYLRARVHADRGQLGEALDLIGQARSCFTAAGLGLQAMRTDLGRMQVLDDLGRHDDAAATGEALLTQLTTNAVGADDRALSEWLRAAALENVGVARSFTGDYERSLEAYAEAEAAYRSMGSDSDVPRPQANRGIELLSLGRAREALTVLVNAAAAFAAAGDRLWSAKCLGNVGQAHRYLGNLARALSVLEPASLELESMDAATEVARVRLAIAMTWLDIGLFEPARLEAERAIALYETAGMRHDEATARATAATALLGQGLIADADAQIRQAATLFEQVEDRLQQARTLLIQSQVAVAAGRRSEAAALADVAARKLREGGWSGPLADALLHQATVADGEDAARALAEADELVSRLDVPQLRGRVDLAKARACRQSGDVAAAEQLLRAAVRWVDTAGDSLPDHAFRTAFRAGNDAASDDLIDLLVDRDPANAAEAFWIANRAKAQTLRDLTHRTLGRSAWQPASNDLVSELAAARGDLHATYLALQQAPDARRRQLLHEQARDLEAAVSALQLRHTAIAVDDVSAPRTPIVNAGAGLDVPTLAFHVVHDDVIAFVGQPDTITARRLRAVVPAIDGCLARLADQWSRFQMGTRFASRHAAMLLTTTDRILEELYALLIEPVADLLADLDGDELVIVPHRQLGDIPFAALQSTDGRLLDRWAITIGPAVVDASPPAAARGQSVVVASPDANAPAVAAEAAAIGERLIDVQLFVGQAATSQVLTGGALSGAGIVHLACHGVYCAENPLFSRLRLSDRWVTATEFLDLDLTGSLVTLSACESGRQGATAEPVGLAWAAIAAGASGVVVSRWVVHDATTAHLMEQMYASMRSGLGPAAALRHAQRALAAAQPHPFYWAPFSYVARPAEM